MAGRLTRCRPRGAASSGAAAALAAALLATLGGCVSTEALYADYDAAECPVAPPPSLAGALPPALATDATETVRELIERSYFPWEPAVYFAFNSADLDAPNTALLAGAIEVLKRYPTLNLGLQGFTDRLGPASYNAWLAGERVRSVRAQLVRDGVPAARIVSQPIGEGLPLFGDDDARGREINRRVELMLLDEMGRPLHPLYDFRAFDEAVSAAVDRAVEAGAPIVEADDP